MAETKFCLVHTDTARSGGDWVCCMVMTEELGAGSLARSWAILRRYIPLVGANLWAVVVRWWSVGVVEV